MSDFGEVLHCYWNSIMFHQWEQYYLNQYKLNDKWYWPSDNHHFDWERYEPFCGRTNIILQRLLLLHRGWSRLGWNRRWFRGYDASKAIWYLLLSNIKLAHELFPRHLLNTCRFSHSYSTPRIYIYHISFINNHTVPICLHYRTFISVYHPFSSIFILSINPYYFSFIISDQWVSVN